MATIQQYLTGAAFIAMVGAASPLYAQANPGAPAAPEAQQSNLEEIVVTARRVEENQQRVPVAVTTLNAAALERNNVKGVTDIQFSVPNLQIRPSRINPDLPEFVVRGQRQQLFTDENVVTYVNSVPQSTRGLVLYDMQNVQVLKGPQGTLFGKNSLGGAVVFTTHRPEFTQSGSLEAQYGNFNLRQITGVVNLPVIEDKLALRLAGRVERRDGAFKNLLPGYGRLDDRNNSSFRVSLLAQPNDRLENSTTFDYIHRREVGTPDITEAAYKNSPFYGLISQVIAQRSALSGATPVTSADGTLLLRQGSPWITAARTGLGSSIQAGVDGKNLLGSASPVTTYGSEAHVYGLANTTTYELNDHFSVKNIFGWRHEQDYESADSGCGCGGFDLVLGTNPATTPPTALIGNLSDNNSNWLYRNNQITDEVQLIGNFDNLKFISGLFYSYAQNHTVYNANFVTGGSSLYPRNLRYSDGDLNTKSSAVFAQGTYDFSSHGIEARTGSGLRANVTHRMSPTRCCGREAAMEIAIGPENDSPSST